jgi:dTDP-4-amino-4,6-dideoxygalactose transaminase
MGRRFGGRPGDCPVTESVSDRLLRLPFYNDLAEDDQMKVIEAILDTAGWQTAERGEPLGQVAEACLGPAS